MDSNEAQHKLSILEQFKNSVLGHIATSISERKVKTVAMATASADGYDLTHGHGWSDCVRWPQGQFFSDWCVVWALF